MGIFCEKLTITDVNIKIKIRLTRLEKEKIHNLLLKKLYRVLTNFMQN